MPTTAMTPPSPGLEREEPDLWSEDDIPTPADEDAEDMSRQTEVRPQQP